MCSKQIEARRADTFIGDFKFYAAPSALVVLGFARSTALRPWLLHNEPAALSSTHHLVLKHHLVLNASPRQRSQHDCANRNVYPRPAHSNYL
jgi:hypothetical protein